MNKDLQKLMNKQKKHGRKSQYFNPKMMDRSGTNWL